MDLYTLTPSEVALINALNYERQNTLLIVCCYGEYTGVDPVSLQHPDFSDYLTALGGTYDSDKVVEIELPTIF
jgi:hypothetical protein